MRFLLKILDLKVFFFCLRTQYLVYDCFKNFDAANVRSFDGTSCIWSWFWFDLILILVLIWFWFDIILILIWFWFDFDLILIWFWFAMRAVFFGERADFGVAGRAEISPPVPVPPPLKMLILHQCIFWLVENAIFAQNPWFESFFLLFAYSVFGLRLL